MAQLSSAVSGAAAAAATAPLLPQMPRVGGRTLQQNHHRHYSNNDNGDKSTPNPRSPTLHTSSYWPTTISSKPKPYDLESSGGAAAASDLSLPGLSPSSTSTPRALITCFPGLSNIRHLSRAIDESPIYRAHRTYSGIDVTRMVLMYTAFIVLLAPLLAGAVHDMHGELRRVMALLAGVQFNVMFGVDIAMAGLWREDKGRKGVRRGFLVVLGVLVVGTVWSAAVDVGWL